MFKNQFNHFNVLLILKKDKGKKKKEMGKRPKESLIPIGGEKLTNGFAYFNWNSLLLSFSNGVWLSSYAFIEARAKEIFYKLRNLKNSNEIIYNM